MFLDTRLQTRLLGILTCFVATHCRADCLTATLGAVPQRDLRLGQAEKHYGTSTWNTAGICCSSLHLGCVSYMLHCNHDLTRCVATLSACMSTCHMHAELPCRCLRSQNIFSSGEQQSASCRQALAFLLTICLPIMICCLQSCY